MTTIAVNAFAGEVPRRGRTLLAPEESSYAVNCLLLSGELRPLHTPLLDPSLSCGSGQVRYAFRLPATLEPDNVWDELWLPFTSDQVCFAKGPLVKDKWERYYWSQLLLNGTTPKPDEEQAYIQYSTREELDAQTFPNCQVDGHRVGVPRPKKEPSVTTEILAHPGSKEHWEGGTTPPPAAASSKALGGEWWEDPAAGWRNKRSDANHDFWQGVVPDMCVLRGLVKTEDKLRTITGVLKNDYALVTNDPNAEKNGWYVAGKAGPIAAKWWKFTGAKLINKQYSESELIENPPVEGIPQPPTEIDGELVSSEDIDGHWREVQRHFVRWDGKNLADFVENMQDTNTVPVEFLDYVLGSEPNEVNTHKDIWGWNWLQADAADVDSTINNLDEVFPESKTEIVTRAYVYTYVNAYGEEGPPSDPRQFDGLDGENWCIHNFDLETPDNDTDYPNMAGPDGRVPVVLIRIYRTITGTSGSADYFYVGEMPISENLPLYGTDITTEIQAEAHRLPKRYEVATNGDLSTVVNVRHGDWLMALQDEDRVIGANDMIIHKWYKATVKDYEGNIDEDNLAQAEYDATNTDPDVYGYEWVEMTGYSTESSTIDSKETSDIGYNDALETYSWFEPPQALQGLTLHPNGFFIAFRGRDLFFSVPYRPHAWPEEFLLTMEHPIVNIAVFGTSIAVLTDGHPYIATGIRPESMTLTKYETPVPCRSFRGVVPMPGAVIFPSQSGLWMASSQGFQNIMASLMTEDEWELHDPNHLTAARDGNKFIGFYDADADNLDVNRGFILNPSEPAAVFSHLRGFEVDNIQTDYTTGQVYYLAGNKIYWWNPANGEPLNFEWWSKVFVMGNPVNFGAFAIGWRPEPITVPIEPTVKAADRLVFTTIPDDMNLPDPLTLRSYQQDIAILWSGVPQEIKRLPAGFRARNWWFKLEGNVVVENVKMAETGLELKQV